MTLATDLGKALYAVLPRGCILYFAPCDWEQGIGGGARLSAMLKVLSDLHYHVYLGNYLPGDRYSSRVIHTLEMDHFRISINRSAYRWLKALAMLPVLLWGISEVWHCEFVLAHAPSIASGFPALLTAKLFRKPLIIDHMDLKDPQTPQWMHNLILRQADKVFCISHWLVDEVTGLGNDRAVYVPNWVDCDLFKPSMPPLSGSRRG